MCRASLICARDEAGHDGVDPAAEVARRGAERDPEHDGEERRSERHLERDAAAVEHAQELVAAELAVPAEDEERRARPRRRLREPDLAGLLHVVQVGAPRGPTGFAWPSRCAASRRARGHEEDQQDEEAERDEGDPVAADPCGRDLPGLRGWLGARRAPIVAAADRSG